ncbi:MAG: glycosyltransferase [Magnetospirillum sp.]|nr:MAG: glycosyltransferase [Magnetospirillum sp.]
MTDTPVLSLRRLDPAEIQAIDRYCDGSAELIALDAVPRSQRLRLLVRLLLSKAERLVVVADHHDPLSPLLLGLAGLSRTEERLRLVDGGFQPFLRSQALAALGQVILSSMAGLVAMALCWVDLAWLAVASPHLGAVGKGSVFYINPTQWRGARVGGAVAHTVGVIKGLVSCGLTVEGVSAVGQGMVPSSVRLQPLDVIKVHGLPTEANLFRHHRRITQQVFHQTKAGGVAFVYQRLTLGTYPGVRLARRLGVPLVLEYNGSEVWVMRNWGNPLRFERLATLAETICLRHAALIVTISQPLADDLVSRGVDPARIVVHPNGVDPDIFDSARYSVEERASTRRSLGLADDAVVAAFVGTFGVWHGAEVLAQALCHLHQHHRSWLETSRLHLLFVGDGLRRGATEALLEDSSLVERVRFAGIVDQGQVPRVLAACDILVSPHVPNADGSRFFGSPTKLFEYLASGRPIIASALDQIAEVLAGSPSVADARPDTPPFDGACAVMVAPGNPAALAEALRLVSDHPSWAAALGEAGRQRALRHHTWHAHVARVLDALRQCFPA